MSCSVSFLSFLLHLLYLSHSLERGKLWIEDIHKYFSIPRYIEKAEQHQKNTYNQWTHINMNKPCQQNTDWHTNMNNPCQQITDWHANMSKSCQQITDWHTNMNKSCQQLADWHTNMNKSCQQITDWHTNMNKPCQQISRYDAEWLLTIKCWVLICLPSINGNRTADLQQL